MSFLLSNAALLPWLALALVPLLVHLFARARPPGYWFSSIAFLQRLQRKTHRIRKPRDVLLWIVRTLAVLALIAVFLRPVIFDGRAGRSGTARHIVVIVDASASMALVEGTRSRFAAACAEAGEVLAGLTDRDTANVVWLRNPPVSIFPATGVNVAFLRSAMRQARVSSEAADPSLAIQLAVDQLRDREGRREVCIVSDFQAANWSGLAPLIPPGIEVRMVRVGAEPGDNQAVTRLRVEPAAPLAGEPLRLYCQVENYSDRAVRAPLYLQAGEFRDRVEVQLAPWRGATALFSLPPLPAGVHPIHVRLGEDAFPADNLRRVLVSVSPYIRAGLHALDADTASSWRRALESLDWVRVESIVEPDAGAFDVRLLAGWDARGEGVLARLMEQGSGVIWAPAPNTPVPLLNRAMGAAPDDGVATLSVERPRNPMRLRVTDPDDPVFRVFASGEFGDPARGTFLARTRIPRISAGRTVMAFEDQVPALHRAERTPWVLWNIPLAASDSDYAARPEFLPLLAELVLDVRRTPDAFLSAEGVAPGRRLAWPVDRPALAAEVRLLDEAGQSHPVESAETSLGVVPVSTRMGEPGLYTWHDGEEMAGYGIVNFPVIESDLRAALPGSLQDRARVYASGRDVQSARDGRPLWPLLLMWGAIFLFCESALTLGGVRA